ncbi:MAG: hypothetical protein WC644_04285 [Ignavibacteria bacterium]
MLLENLIDQTEQNIIQDVPVLTADIVERGVKKARPKKGWAHRLSEQVVLVTTLRNLFSCMFYSSSSFQIRQENFFINQMDTIVIKMTSYITFVYQFIDSLITKSKDCCNFLNGQVAGRFHNDSLPNTLLFFQKLSTPPSHINNQIFTTNKNSLLK